MNNNYQAPPFIQRDISNKDISIDFFNIFDKKYLKLGLAFFSAMVSIIGNFYAIKQQIYHMRLDMLGNDFMISMYAIGITFMLDTMIIIFHLMKMKSLANFSTFSALSISIYANIMLAIQIPGGDKITTMLMILNDPSILITVVIGFCMAVLPVLTIVYLMSALTEQIENERKFNNMM
jgi:hypothetical protein